MPPYQIPQPTFDTDTWTRVVYEKADGQWAEGTLMSYSNHPPADPPPPTTPKLERAKEYQKEAQQRLRDAQRLYQESPDVDVKDPDTGLTPEEAALVAVHTAKDELDEHIARVRELTSHIPIEDQPEGPLVQEVIHIFDVDTDDDPPQRVTLYTEPGQSPEEVIRLAT